MKMFVWTTSLVETSDIETSTLKSEIKDLEFHSRSKKWQNLWGVRSRFYDENWKYSGIQTQLNYLNTQCNFLFSFQKCKKFNLLIDFWSRVKLEILGTWNLLDFMEIGCLAWYTWPYGWSYPWPYAWSVKYLANHMTNNPVTSRHTSNSCSPITTCQ